MKGLRKNDNWLINGAGLAEDDPDALGGGGAGGADGERHLRRAGPADGQRDLRGVEPGGELRRPGQYPEQERGGELQLRRGPCRPPRGDREDRVAHAELRL